MKHQALFLILIVVLVACGQSQEDAPMQHPAPTPTATSLSSAFAGPMLNTSSLGDASESACTAESGCVVVAQEVAAEPAMPLTAQTIGAVTLGIPEGYTVSQAGDQIIVSAISLETEGGFIVGLRPVEAAPADFEWGNGTPIQLEAGAGHWLLHGEHGAVALLTDAEGQMLLVEAFSSPGYWAAFHATFEAMLPTIIF